MAFDRHGLPGELGVPAADKSRTGTYRALVDMRNLAHDSSIKSGYLLIARALDDGTIKWIVADQVSVDALDKLLARDLLGARQRGRGRGRAW